MGFEKMDTFSKAGESLLLAEEGNRAIAATVAAVVRGWLTSFKAWLAAMPTSMPPTEAQGGTPRLPTIG